MLCKVPTLLSLNTNVSSADNLYPWEAFYFLNRTHFRVGLCVGVNNSLFHQLNLCSLWGKWSQRAVSGVRESICYAPRKLTDASFMISLKAELVWVLEHFLFQRLKILFRCYRSCVQNWWTLSVCGVKRCLFAGGSWLETLQWLPCIWYTSLYSWTFSPFGHRVNFTSTPLL